MSKIVIIVEDNQVTKICTSEAEVECTVLDLDYLKEHETTRELRLIIEHETADLHPQAIR